MGLVTGYFLTPDGTPVSGTAQFQLSKDCIYPVSACVAPTVINFPVLGGTLSCSAVFNDVMTPTTSAYYITVKDSGWGQVWGGNYSLVSGTANLNLLAPQ
jgi:hypothetical protein